MRILAIDTSTLRSSVGWIRTSDAAHFSQIEVHDWAEISAPATPGHAETLLQRIDSVLSMVKSTLKDVDLFVYGRGPGTFTGLRIGLSTIKGLAFAAGKPIVGISSLEALAFSAPVDAVVACLIDARRRELFAGVYKVTRNGRWPRAQTVVPEWVAKAPEVIARLRKQMAHGPLFLVGNGIEPYVDLVREECPEEACVILPEQHWAPSGPYMAEVGLKRFLDQGPDNLEDALPVYLREPDAKLPRPQ